MRDHVRSTAARLDWLALALITLLAAVLRFYRLDTVPPGFHYDEAYEALEAWRVITQADYRPLFFAGNFGVDPMFIYLTSLAFRLFGADPGVMRGVAALVGTLTVPLIYGLGREIVAWRAGALPATALFTALALAVMRWHIHYSRVGIEPILVPFFLTVLLWALWRGLRTGSASAWLVAGAVTGLAPYTYPAARLFPLVVMAVVGAALTLRPELVRTNWRGIVFAGVVAAAVFAPLALHWMQHPDQLLLRSSQIAAGVGDTPAVSPWRNFWATLAMLNFRGDPDPRNNIPGAPALDVLMSIPFFIGLLLALRRWRAPVWTGLLAAGLVMLLPTILSEYAPHFRRAVGATPVIAVLCGAGLAVLLGGRVETGIPAAPIPWRVAAAGADPAETAAAMGRLRRLGRQIVVAAILIGSAVLSVTGYFGRWARDPALFYAYDEGLWQIGSYVLGLPAGQPTLVSPRPAEDMTLAFAWREGSPARHFDGRHALLVPTEALSGAGANYVIIEHEDFRGVGLLQQLFPDAREIKTFTDRAGQVYARVFRTPPGAGLERTPMHPVDARWPDIELIGYDLDRPAYKPGEIVYLQLWWRATGQPETDWTVFTHVIGEPNPDGGVVWAGKDARPGQGSIPTTAWRPGDLILDEYQIALPAEMPAGEYQIEVGLYDPAAGGARAQTIEPPGHDHVILGEIVVR